MNLPPPFTRHDREYHLLSLAIRYGAVKSLRYLDPVVSPDMDPAILVDALNGTNVEVVRNLLRAILSLDDQSGLDIDPAVFAYVPCAVARYFTELNGYLNHDAMRVVIELTPKDVLLAANLAYGTDIVSVLAEAKAESLLRLLRDFDGFEDLVRSSTEDDKLPKGDLVKWLLDATRANGGICPIGLDEGELPGDFRDEYIENDFERMFSMMSSGSAMQHAQSLGMGGVGSFGMGGGMGGAPGPGMIYAGPGFGWVPVDDEEYSDYE
ncbi:hypothetical protein H9P43_003983 [Blastocladiella emersonii ATCC 22665]|nr:hypothetical protein H9P43_003983 [Blastocladiella emersonii ATCC 22665]